MTKIDRYILMLFFRTVFVCFCSIAGVFVVFHAFTTMDDFVELSQKGKDGLAVVMVRYYGPYMLLLYDWTGAIISLLAVLFVVGWLRHTGELTATLAAGISHGRILKPMIYASMALVALQLVNREFVLPRMRDALSMKVKHVKNEAEQAILPCYDKTSAILFEGRVLHPRRKIIDQPNFRLYGDYQAFGELLLAESAVWLDASAEHPSGYLMRNVKKPDKIDELRSIGTVDRPILMTSADQQWLKSRECFVATTVTPDLLSTDQSATRLSSVAELAERVKNPAVHSSLSLHVLLHERMIRPPLDFSLVLLCLPLVVNRRDRNLFVMIGIAIFTVLVFYLLKTVSGAMGGSGYLITPALAAWIPLLILGPIAYMRLRDVQTV